MGALLSAWGEAERPLLRSPPRSPYARLGSIADHLDTSKNHGAVAEGGNVLAVRGRWSAGTGIALAARTPARSALCSGVAAGRHAGMALPLSQTKRRML